LRRLPISSWSEAGPIWWHEVDWFSRAVLAYRLSNSKGVEFCLEALHEALLHHGPPELFNSDQGAQFTAVEVVAVLLAHEVRVSMDGKGRCLDNVFVERLWSSLKYEEEYVYPSPYANVHEAWTGISRSLHFYNHRRPHQALGYRTPMEVYCTGHLALAA
jgi:putative transposase